MSITEITHLPMREKFQIMELLWEDMRSSVDEAGTPKGHQDLLDSRRARVENGEVSVLDWNQVKSSIGRE
jgi:hypothetical protein